jgi:peptide/nickel transport system substrate-binding protein/oligopeptide transport system substrate-binding protein
MRRARFLVVVAAVATLAMAACGGDGDDSPEGGDSPDGNEEVTGGTVHLGMADPGTLLPQDSNTFDNIRILDVLFSGLVRYDVETTEPYNYVAESITSDDNTTWTIKIKEGWTFHNGEPVDAAAFARAWNYAAYGPNAMANNYFFERIVGYDEMQAPDETTEPEAEELSGLRVVDDVTLEVELHEPFGSFAAMLGYTGFYPMAQECLDDIEACAMNPIGNGPFQADGAWQPEVGLTVSRWEDYPGDEQPNFESVEWTAYLGDDVSWPDFLAGDIDASEPPPAEWEAAMNDPDLSERVISQNGTALTYLGFPLYDEKFTDVNLRRAFALGIDMETIVDTIVPGRYVAADSWVVPGGVPGGEAGTCEYCRFDPEEAQRLLDEAGGWPAGDVLTITYGADPTSEAIFKAIGDQLKQNLGIDYQLDPTEDFFSRRSERDFAGGVFRNNWFPDYPLNENYLAPIYGSGPDGNNFAYHNADFEAKLADGDRAPTLEEAVTHYQEAERILAEDLPTIPLTWTQSTTFYSDRLDNVVLNPFSGAIELRKLTVTS